ncbi:MAG: hypothetical protein D6729_01225 [Deltaproteobacteria bacterium]|nr:MAG: hypothetical protein D6729_01225 [Deltaproteobacteria bacterium]
MAQAKKKKATTKKTGASAARLVDEFKGVGRCGYRIAQKASGNQTLASNEYAVVTYIVAANVGALAGFSGVPVTLTVHYGPGETVEKSIQPITAGTAVIRYVIHSGVVFRNC